MKFEIEPLKPPAPEESDYQLQLCSIRVSLHIDLGSSAKEIKRQGKFDLSSEPVEIPEIEKRSRVCLLYRASRGSVLGILISIAGIVIAILIALVGWLRH